MRNNRTAHQQKRFGFQAGITSIEYILVGSLITIVVGASLVTLGQSTSLPYERLSKSINLDSTEAKPHNASVVDNTVDSSLADNRRLRYLLMFACLTLVFFGSRYFQLRKQKRAPAPTDCPQTAIVLKQQSEALRHILRKRNVIHGRLCEDWVKMFHGEAEIAPYMSTELVTVRPDMSCQACLEMLVENGYRRVLVSDKNNHLLGIVSKKDIQSKSGKVVAEVMTNDPKIANPKTSLRIALSILLAHRVSCIPVVDDGLLVGLLSTSDLLVVLQSIVIILSGDSKKELPIEQLATSMTTAAPASHVH